LRILPEGEDIIRSLRVLSEGEDIIRSLRISRKVISIEGIIGFAEAAAKQITDILVTIRL
jgi:hypothetical protein